VGRTLDRRQLLQGGCAALGLCLLGGPAAAYQPGKVERPARLSGRVRWAGRAGKPARLKLTGSCPYCLKQELHAEDLLQAPGGGLRNVAVFLEGVQQGRALPTSSPVLAERRCTFVPHVMTVSAGTRLLLQNDDPVLNTFHAIEVQGGRTLFNEGLANQGQKLYRKIRRPGLIKVLCDVHPWEVAYLVAFDHPYHVVSDAEGRFALEEIPPGRYTLGLWHEKLGGRRQQVELAPGAHLKLDLVYPS
jgi:hypothetical protein